MNVCVMIMINHTILFRTMCGWPITIIIMHTAQNVVWLVTTGAFSKTYMHGCVMIMIMIMIVCECVSVSVCVSMWGGICVCVCMCVCVCVHVCGYE